MTFEPVVLFFLLGAIAGLMRSDLKTPGSIYEALSIFLLLAIGLNGGLKLAENPLGEIILPGIAIVLAGALIPLLAFSVLRYVGRMNRPDSASIAAHYGSVSVVTFSVGVTFLSQKAESFEGQMMSCHLARRATPSLMPAVAAHTGYAAANGVRVATSAWKLLEMLNCARVLLRAYNKITMKITAC